MQFHLRELHPSNHPMDENLFSEIIHILKLVLIQNLLVFGYFSLILEIYIIIN